MIVLRRLEEFAKWSDQILLVLSDRSSIDWSDDQANCLLKTEEIWIFGNASWDLHDQLDNFLLARQSEGPLPITNAITELESQIEAFEELLLLSDENTTTVLFDFTMAELATRFLRRVKI